MGHTLEARCVSAFLRITTRNERFTGAKNKKTKEGIETFKQKNHRISSACDEEGRGYFGTRLKILNRKTCGNHPSKFEREQWL